MYEDIQNVGNVETKKISNISAPNLKHVGKHHRISGKQTILGRNSQPNLNSKKVGFMDSQQNINKSYPNMNLAAGLSERQIMDNLNMEMGDGSPKNRKLEKKAKTLGKRMTRNKSKLLTINEEKSSKGTRVNTDKSPKNDSDLSPIMIKRQTIGGKTDL